MVTADGSLTILNSMTNMGLSLGPSSLVTGANSVVSKGPKSHKSASTGMDHLNLPSLPICSSYNLSVSGPSATGDSSVAWQDPHLGQNSSKVQKWKQQQEGLYTTSQPGLQKSLNSLLDVKNQELSTLTQMHKRSRLAIKQDATLHQNIIQQLLQS